MNGRADCDGSVTGEKSAHNADSTAEHENAEGSQKERMRSDGVDRITDPSEGLRDDGTGFGHKRSHSHGSRSSCSRKDHLSINKFCEST